MSKSTMVILFIIITILAMFKLNSIMGGLGFVLTFIILAFAIIIILGAIGLLISAYENWKKDWLSVMGNSIGGVLLLLAGVKILVWLMGTLF